MLLFSEFAEEDNDPNAVLPKVGFANAELPASFFEILEGGVVLSFITGSLLGDNLTSDKAPNAGFPNAGFPNAGSVELVSVDVFEKMDLLSAESSETEPKLFEELVPNPGFPKDVFPNSKVLFVSFFLTSSSICNVIELKEGFFDNLSRPLNGDFFDNSKLLEFFKSSSLSSEMVGWKSPVGPSFFPSSTSPPSCLYME